MTAPRLLPLLLLSLCLSGCTKKRAEPPAPPAERAASEAAPEGRTAPAFEVIAESVADLRILRYQVPDWPTLSLRQKRLAYYLQEAALSGRDITYDQNYEHNLLVRHALEAIVKGHLDASKPRDPAFEALFRYLKRVWFSNGIHHHDSGKKLVPEGFGPSDLSRLVGEAKPSDLPLRKKETREQLAARLAPILFDPTLAATRVNKDPERDPVADSANHFYEGLTRAEVESYTKEQRIDDARPVSVGLNSQLVKASDGRIEERVWKIGGMYGPALERAAHWLHKAAEVAENEAQRDAILKLITYYTTGSLEDWDRFNMAWVADTTSKIDFIHGFVETYGDAMNLRGSFEALIELEDGVGKKRIQALGRAAQWFEDHSPIPERYKRESVVGVSARAVQAILAVGDSAPPMPTGVNLPNSRWIREQHGSKSITISNVLAAYEAASRDSGSIEEFTSGAREAERARAHGELAEAVMVDMHEVIGHASGKLAPDVRDPGETLRHYASTLEEARADLVALYYALDPKLIELGVIPSLEVGRAAYDGFIRDALLVQLAGLADGERLEEAHMRSRQTIAAWAFDKGGPKGVIRRISRDRKTYFVVQDYVTLRALFGELLREVQRILSEGDFDAGQRLVERYGVRVDEALHREVLGRYRTLGIAPYAGFIQPELIPVEEDGAIVDVRLELPRDFSAQQLRWSSKHALLPIEN